MKIKKILTTVLVVVVILAIGLYFAVPVIARGVIHNKISDNPNNSVGSIDISWGGPQIISALHVVDSKGTADVDVTINNSLLSLVLSSSQIDVLVQGDASITTSSERRETIPAVPDDAIATGGTSKQQPISIPGILLTLELSTVTIIGDEPTIFHDVHATVDVEPGMHFAAVLRATTELGGVVDIDCSAPNFLAKNGELNWDASATCTLNIENSPIPTINGIGGWSVIKMKGNISSPNLNDAINFSLDGSLAEYDTPRGSIMVKAQLIKSNATNSAFVFGGKEIVGTVSLIDVPSTILDPLLNIVAIDVPTEIGPTMKLHVQRKAQESTLIAHLKAKELQIDGTVDSDDGLLSNISITANIRSELLQKLTDNQFSGNATATIHFDQLVPVGTSSNDKPECLAEVRIVGELLHVPTTTTVTSLNCTLAANVLERIIAAEGSITCNGEDSNFDLRLSSTNKNKLDGLDDLFKTIGDQLPQGTGNVSITNVPASIFQSYVSDKRFKLGRDVGFINFIDATLKHNSISFKAKSSKIITNGSIELRGSDIHSFSGVVEAAVTKTLVHEFTGIKKPASFKANIESADMKGNSSFNVTVNIEKQSSFLQGKTTKNDDGTLDLHVAATGIPTQFIDPILFDAIGSPLAVELIATDVLNAPSIVAGGTSPHSNFDTKLLLQDGMISTISKTTTKADLTLSPSLTQRLLKDLGPVLSDIRTVKRPIVLTIKNATSSLNNDVAKLQADIVLDIGEVMLDNGSATLKLLSLFNTKHNKHIPAYFDPIHIQIRKGVVTYQEFRLTLANKYSMPYSGTINLVNRTLNLHTAVPLTGLGYSIKELRGLATDIDVPIVITGTIDKPIVNVDKNFDLGKILQSAALDSIGDVLGGLLGGDSKNNNAPDPLKLLEELLGK